MSQTGNSSNPLSSPDQRLLLGSSSRYRATLLERLRLPFEQASPDIDETPRTGELPADLVLRLAAGKADALRREYEGYLIIASDQVASIDDQLLGKPGTRENAIRQLETLSGQTVAFYTSILLQDARRDSIQQELDITEVTFRSLSRPVIEDYVDQEMPLDCAGAFKSEGLGIALFQSINTCDPSALIGLPLIRLCGMLANAGYPVLGRR